MPDKPTLDDLIALLRAAPPRHALQDERYRRWRVQVEAMLRRVDETTPTAA